MKLQASVVLLFILLNGCAFHSGPKGNQDFYQISQMSELAGVYKNRGDPAGFLSEIILGNIKPNIDPETNHEDIEFIEVVSAENSLTVRAIKGGCMIYEKPYVIERDFKIEDGRIILHRDVFLLTRGAQDVMLGPSSEQITLGLDAGKHGKWRRLDYMAGLVYLVFPVAGSITSDIRFERVKAKPQEFDACGNR